MALLSSNELRKLIKANPPLLENAVDTETQIQPNGLELTLKEIKTIEGAGAVDFDNSERKVPDAKPPGIWKRRMDPPSGGGDL